MHLKIYSENIYFFKNTIFLLNDNIYFSFNWVVFFDPFYINFSISLCTVWFVRIHLMNPQRIFIRSVFIHITMNHRMASIRVLVVSVQSFHRLQTHFIHLRHKHRQTQQQQQQYHLHRRKITNHPDNLKNLLLKWLNGFENHWPWEKMRFEQNRCFFFIVVIVYCVLLLTYFFLCYNIMVLLQILRNIICCRKKIYLKLTQMLS